MKILAGLFAIAAAMGFLVAGGLGTVAKKVEKPEIEPNSVAFYCTRAIPDIIKTAQREEKDANALTHTVAFKAFDLIATNYCVCNQEAFGSKRRAREKQMFGLLAGLNLKMEFTQSYGKVQRDALKKEGQQIAKKFGGLVKSKPSWMKEINATFRTCKKEQSLGGSLKLPVSR